MLRRLALAFLFFAPFAFAPGASADEAGGVAEVDACVRGNLPEKTSVQTVKIVSTDRSGGDRTLEAKIYWRRTKNDENNMFAEIDAPPNDRGSRYLFLENKNGVDDAFVYLPEIGRARRILPRSGSGSLFGTDFTYEDITRMQSISGGDEATERLPDADLDGRPVSVVSARPKPEEGSAYERILYFVDQESCVPLKIEFYEPGGNLRKVLTAPAERVSKEGEGWIAREVLMRDLVGDTQSQLLVEKIELDVKIKRKIFSQHNLQTKGH